MSTTHQVIIGFGIIIGKSELLDCLVNAIDDFDDDADMFKRYFEDDCHYIMLKSSIIDQDSDYVVFDPEKLKYKQSEYIEFVNFLSKNKISNKPQWYAFKWSF